MASKRGEGRRGRATRVGVSAASLLALSLGVAPALWAAPPQEGLPAPDSVGLPDVGSEDGSEAGEGFDELSLEEQREAEFADHLGRGKRAAQQRRFREAISEYTAALEIRKGQPDALRGRAHAYKRQAASESRSCSRQGIEDLTLLEVFDPRGLWLSERVNAVAWMGDCGELYAKERLQIAQELAALTPSDPARPKRIRVTVAELHANEAKRVRGEQQQRLHVDAALESLVAYRAECLDRGVDAALEALMLEAELLRGLEDTEAALRAYQRVTGTYPEAVEAAREAKNRIEELEIQLAVAEIQEKQGGKPPAEAEAAYRRGLEAMRRGDLDYARKELELAVAEWQWYPRAQYYLGEVCARSGDFPRAIDAFKRAIAMERFDYSAHMALGLLYKKEFSGAEDEQARSHLDMALRLRPDLNVLHFHLGELYARSDKERAIDHFRRYLEAEESDEAKQDTAREAIAALEREVDDGFRFVPPPSLSSDMRLLDPELHRLISEAYVLGAEHGEWDRAEKLLLEARKKFPDEPPLLNMLAQVVSVQEGRDGQARVYWDESLAVDPNQQEVHERMGLMLGSTKEGRAHLRRAADLGSVIARYRLAKLMWDSSFEWWVASEELDIYLREAGPYDVYWDSATQLRGDMDAAFRKIYLGIGLISFVFLSIPFTLIWRRVRGSSLPQLLENSPTCFPEVARILSLIRHEILKHNTAFLSDVGHALELDEPDAEARATLLARRLFGDEVERDDIHDPHRGERRGIYGRFLGYVRELEQVARAHGVTLNLRRKDPTFKAMLRAFEDVAAKAKQLRHPGGLRPGAKLELARVLLRAGDVLGRRAFDRLSDVIRKLCIAQVDAEFISQVYEEVATEDKFSSVQILPLSLVGEGEKVRIFPSDLHDILANVLRNSLMSAAMYAEPPIRLEVELDTEIDDITGLSSLAIRIKDRSPERLTNEMLRGRYVERGMGITADLLSRYDGSIAVEPEPGWEKAVVLRFFALDDEDEVAGDAPLRADELSVPSGAPAGMGV